MKEATNRKLQNVDKVTLVQDGWSNIHNEPVVAHSIRCNGKSYLLNAVPTQDMEKSSDNCAKLLEEAMALSETLYGVEVNGVCTDNASSMKKMRKTIQEKKPQVETWGCSAHLLNLLGQELTPDAIMGRVVKVQKHFRNHHREGACLQDKANTVKPQLPCATQGATSMLPAIGKVGLLALALG